MTASTSPPLLAVADHGSGPPVVLVHGFGANRSTWRHWVGPLAEDHRVLNVDLKGFGEAPKPDDGRYALTDLAGEVHRLVLREDLCDVTLVGHSMGGAVVLLVALALLDDGEGRLGRLVSVSGAAYPQTLPPFIALARWRWAALAGLAILPSRLVAGGILRQIVFNPASVDDVQVDAYAEPLRTGPARRALVQCAQQLVPDDPHAVVRRYGEIDVPALMLWGAHDRVVPPWVGRRLAHDLPQGRLVLIERCGHVPPEERPAESLAAVRGFLERT